MKILVIDGQGGRIGKTLVEEIKKRYPDIFILAVGTNNTATASMIKAGADEAATGENSVVVASKMADAIMGPIGILIADSMLGEVTEKMVMAIGRSAARKIIIPMNRCNNRVAGVGDNSTQNLIDNAMELLDDFLVNGKNEHEC